MGDHMDDMDDLAAMKSVVNNRPIVRPPAPVLHVSQMGAAPATAPQYVSNESDFDKAVIFLHEFRVMNVVREDLLKSNDLYFKLTYEEAPNGYSSKLFTHTSEVREGAGANATWRPNGMPHIDTSIENVEKRPLTFELYDKERVWADRKIGTAKISLKSLIKDGQDKPIDLNFEILANGGKLVGEGQVKVSVSAPFNWLTCGLHEPTCISNYCGSLNMPSALNGFGCCYGPTTGQCHLPNGEKCLGLHMPECLQWNRPSVANCGGIIHPKSFGTFPAIDEGCGEFGLCTFSMRCCGNDLHCFPFLTDGCEDFEMEFGLPISFSKAKLTITNVGISYYKSTNGSIVEEDKESVDSQGIPRAVNNNKYWFEMQLLDDQGKVAKMLQSEVKPGGVWNVFPSFEVSSDVLYNHDLEVRLWQKHPLGKDVLVGVGSNGHDLIELLKNGYRMMPTNVPVALRAIEVQDGLSVHTVTAILNFQMRLQEDVAVREKVASPQQHRGSTFFMDQKAESIALTPEMFQETQDLHITHADEQALKFQSATNMEALIGYQIELYSKSTGVSKGIWVIAGVKKYRLFSPQYLLKSIEGGERWTVLEQPILGSDGKTNEGKPFHIRRKVASF